MDSLFDTLHGLGLIPVIKVDHADDAVPLCRALAEGGLPVAEITFRTAAAAEAIARVRRELPQVLAGAGTVTSLELAQKALDAGSQYIVTPGFNPEVVRWCLEHKIPVLPGCTTASEVEMAQNMGIEVVKFFPAEQSGGIARIKALSGPYHQMRFIPTGGINAANIMDYLASDKVVACGGSFMVTDALIKAKDWQKITAITREAMQAIVGLKLERVIFGTAQAPAAGDEKADLGQSLAAFAGTLELACATTGSDAGAQDTLVYSAHSLERACFGLRASGLDVDPASATRDGKGKLTAVTLSGRLRGFTVRIVRKG